MVDEEPAVPHLPPPFFFSYFRAFRRDCCAENGDLSDIKGSTIPINDFMETMRNTHKEVDLYPDFSFFMLKSLHFLTR